MVGYMLWFYKNGKLPEEPDLSYLNQITDDWTTLPFVKLYVMPARNETLNKTENCPTEYPDEVFYTVWPGTYKYCDCENSAKIYLQEDCKVASLITPEGCIEQPAHAPVTLSDLNGFKVCGVRGGTNFLNAKRAIASPNGNLTCSDAGYQPCDY